MKPIYIKMVIRFTGTPLYSNKSRAFQQRIRAIQLDNIDPSGIR